MTEARALKDKAAQLFTKGKFAKAAETYEEFCSLDKKDHQARLRCGDAWAKAGKKDKAITSYSAAAEGFARDGFLPRAIAASKLVLEIDPSHKGVQKMLAELYAQKSGGGPKKAAGPSGPGAPGAPGQEMEIQRNVSAPVSSSFANNKKAIDLDAPVAQPAKKQGYQPAKVEAPSPMNRADALELPEYEIPMGDAGVTTTAQGGHQVKGNTRAIAIEDSGPAEAGPKALVETSIDIDMGAGQPVTGEVEIPIEGQPLPDVDQLPAELQMATPLAPAITFDVSAPPAPAQNYELQVEEPKPSAPTPVYDLTEAIPEPKPSVPVFELTEEIEEAPPPPPASPPPAMIIEEPAPVAKAKVGVVDLTPTATPVAAEPLDAPLHAEARFEPLDPPLTTTLEPLDAPLELQPRPKLEPLDAPLELQPKAKVEPLDAPLELQPKPKLEPLDAPLELEPKSQLEPLEAPLELQPKPLAPAPATVSRVSAPQPPAAPRTSALPPSVGDAASAPPSIKPLTAETAAPPGLKPRKAEPASSPPAVPASSPSSSRIWLPPTFTPAAARTETESRPSAASSAAVPTPAEASTDLERSLQTFMQFDPDAPAPARAPAPPPEPVAEIAAPAAKVAPSFTELDLDEGDSLLHAVEAVATTAAPNAAAAVVEEAMEAEDARPEPGGLPKIPLFSDLPEDAFIALFEKCPLQRFDEGQVVFEEGDKADAFYVICGGRVRVVRTVGEERKELATLEEGSFFGEMALLSEAPRSASVEAAAEDTQVLVISAEILKELSASYPVVSTALKKFCRQRMLSNLMNTAPIFSPFNKSDRRDLVQKFRARDVGRGDVLVKEGSISDGLYVVLSGEVAVEAKGQRIATLKEGQVFGEMSLLTRTPAGATVRATRHTSLLRLPKQDFDGLILSHPQVLEHVSTLIDERKKNDLRRAQKNDAAGIL